MGDESNTADRKRPSTGTIMELFDEATNAIYEMDSNELDITLSNAVAILVLDFLLEFLKKPFILILMMSAPEEH